MMGEPQDERSLGHWVKEVLINQEYLVWNVCEQEINSELSHCDLGVLLHLLQQQDIP